MMILGRVFLDTLLLISWFLPVYPLKITVKSSQIPLQADSSTALQKIFLLLRKAADYDAIYRILELKTIDPAPAYIDSCRSIKDYEYKQMVEDCFLMDQVDRLGKLLSPECVNSMDPTIFANWSISISLWDLPRSVLAFNDRSFKFRSKNLKGTFTRIVAHALRNRFLDVKWANLVTSLHQTFQVQNRLTLSEAFDTATFASNPIFEQRLFYYLNPSMLKSCFWGGDVSWLVQMVLPKLPILVPFDIDSTNFVPQKYLVYWNDQVIRAVSTLAFYFKLLELKRDTAKSDTKKELLESIDAAIDSALDKLNYLNAEVMQLLSRKPKCPPFKRILGYLKLLHEIFIAERIVGYDEINALYRNLSYLFKMRAPAAIQGDWMINLFDLFWKRKFHVLRNREIINSLKIFFEKEPTIHAIEKVFKAYKAAFNQQHSSGANSAVISAFEKLIPDNRLVEVFEHCPSMLENTFTRVSFEVRFALFLRESRKKMSASNHLYQHEAHFHELPHISEYSQNRIMYKNRLLDVFRSTTEALYRYETKPGTVMSYGRFEFITKNFVKPVDIRDCLRQFFNLILVIKDFRIRNREASDDGRLIIMLSPLMTKDVGFILGQALAIAAILNVPIPFVIYEPQFKAIYSRASNEHLDEIRAVFKKPGYINLLKFDRQASGLTFLRSFRNYFKSFYNWSNLFSQNPPEDSDLDSIIVDSFDAFYVRVYAGLQTFFLGSKFSAEEIYRILFKINT